MIVLRRITVAFCLLVSCIQIAAAQGKDAASIRLSSLTPSTITEGSTLRSLTVRGTGFNSKSQIRLDGDHRQTTYVSASELRTLLLATDVVSPRTVAITVFTPGTGASASLPLTVTAAAPPPTMSISRLEPSSAIPGTQTVATIGVRGANFTNSMIIRWNGVARTTSFLISSLLTTTVSSADMATQGTANVTVFDPATGSETPGAIFYIDASKSGIPNISILGRSTTVAGSPFSTAINGSGFIFGSIVRVNGVALAANQVSYNGQGIIGMQLPASLIAVPGAYRITVFNPGPSGGESNAVTLTVTAP